MSCFTIAAADGLARIFPEARFVHSVRDGRDSGSSKVSLRQKAHHPTDVRSGIDFWADRLRQAEDGVRGLEPADRERVGVVSLDDLVWGDREAAYEELLDFLGVGDQPAMREFFERRMSAEAAHRERWREGLSEAEQAELSAEYERDPRSDRARGLSLRAGAAALLRAHARSPMSDARILFITSNGTGLGHLTRSLAIARRLPESVEALFITLSAAAPVVEELGYPVEYIASYGTPAAGNDWRWSRRLRARLGEAIAEADPAAIVFDGTHPYEAAAGGASRRAARARGLVPAAAVGVGLEQGAARPLGSFDAILEPGELARPS